MDLATSVRVERRQPLADDQVVELRLGAVDGSRLPEWTPGSHIDVVLPSGLIRQYSLCGDPSEPTYTVAILRDQASRGGSEEIHSTIDAGSTLMIRGPRNHFPLVGADHYIFIAGGIGVTPLLTMARSVASEGATWEFHYGGRSRAAMAYADDLRALDGIVTLYPQDAVGLLPVEDILDSAPIGSAIYTCGPEPLLVAVEQHGAERGHAVHLERFGPSSTRSIAAVEDAPFTVVLQRSARALEVPANARLIDVVREVLPMVPFSCEEGYCGSCETAVLDGIPDHRDTVLTEDERASNACMMICVGRSKTPQLVLDL